MVDGYGKRDRLAGFNRHIYLFRDCFANSNSEALPGEESRSDYLLCRLAFGQPWALAVVRHRAEEATVNLGERLCSLYDLRHLFPEILLVSRKIKQGVCPVFDF